MFLKFFDVFLKFNLPSACFLNFAQNSTLFLIWPFLIIGYCVYIALLCSNLETLKDCRIGTEVQKTIENFHMVLTLCYTKLLCSSLRNGKIYEKKVWKDFIPALCLKTIKLSNYSNCSQIKVRLFLHVSKSQLFLPIWNLIVLIH